MAKPSLRVAGEDDAPTVPSSITASLDLGPREVMAAMRYALAKKLDDGDVSSNAIASAYKELRELDRQIRTIDAAEQEEQRRGSSTGARRSFSATAI